MKATKRVPLYVNDSGKTVFIYEDCNPKELSQIRVLQLPTGKFVPMGNYPIVAKGSYDTEKAAWNAIDEGYKYLETINDI